MTDAPSGLDRHHFRGDQADAAQRSGAVVGNMQIVDFAVLLPGVHQHRRHHDPVLQGDAAQGKRLKNSAHGPTSVAVQNG
ncbi:hypothetical protein D3C75_793690 [compost metagenome]